VKNNYINYHKLKYKIGCKANHIFGVIKMAGNKTNKQSKNNPDNKIIKKENKIISSSECERCKEQCDAYFNYVKLLASGKVGRGVICKK
jgi:hypothetical protein